MNVLSLFKKSKEAKNASWLIGGKLAQMVVGLVVSSLTARHLGPSNYGILHYVSSYVSFFTALCTLGINSVIIKNFIDHPKEQGKTIGSALMLRIVAGLLSAVCMIATVYILDDGDPVIVTVAVLSGLSLIFHVFETFNFWFQSRYQSKISSIATFVAYLCISAYKIVLLILDKNVVWFAFSSSLDYIAVAIFLWISYKKNNGPQLSFSFAKCKQLLSSSYHYILSSLMVTIYGQTDKIMLKHMLNESEVAYYSAATHISTLWCFVLAAIIDSIYPTILTLFNQDKQAFEKKNRQLYAITFYVSMFASLAITILGRHIIWLLYGKAYLNATLPLSIITWYTAFSYLGVARNAWIVSMGCQKYLKYIYGAAVVLNVGLNILLIPSMGAAGAAIASLATQIGTSIVLPLFLKGMRRNSVLMLQGIVLYDTLPKKENKE